MLGMSGGTDSSVAAMKLQESGYEVTGVTLRLHDDGGRGAEEASRLANRLGIEHFEYDAREAFEAQVVRYFTEEYLAGRTPVPCTVCNNRLKWPLLARLADERRISNIGFLTLRQGTTYARCTMTGDGISLLPPMLTKISHSFFGD